MWTHTAPCIRNLHQESFDRLVGQALHRSLVWILTWVESKACHSRWDLITGQCVKVTKKSSYEYACNAVIVLDMLWQKQPADELLLHQETESTKRFLFLTSESAQLEVTPIYRYTSMLDSFWIIWCMHLDGSGWIHTQQSNSWHVVFLGIRIRFERDSVVNATEECRVLLRRCSRLQVPEAATAPYSDQILWRSFVIHTSGYFQRLCKFKGGFDVSLSGVLATTCHCHAMFPALECCKIKSPPS